MARIPLPILPLSGLQGSRAGLQKYLSPLSPKGPRALEHKFLNPSDFLDTDSLDFSDGMRPADIEPSWVEGSVTPSTRDYLINSFPISRSLAGTPLDSPISEWTSPFPESYILPPDWKDPDEVVQYQPSVWPRYLMGRTLFQPSKSAPQGVKSRFGSGVLVGPRHVLTASHCVPTIEWFDQNPMPTTNFVEQFVSHADIMLGDAYFVPGYYQDPYAEPGSFKSQVFTAADSGKWLGVPYKVEKVIALLAINWELPTPREPDAGWWDDWMVFLDVAVLVLEKPLGENLGWCATDGWLPFETPLVKSSHNYPSWLTVYDYHPKNRFQLLGYPGTKKNGITYGDFDTHVKWEKQKKYKGMGGHWQRQIAITTKTSPGMSGGPLWRYLPEMGWPAVQGVVSNDKCVGGSLTKWMVSWARKNYK